MLMCAICREREAAQEHHLSWYPEIKIDICKKCHDFIHGHTTGLIRTTSRNLMHYLWSNQQEYLTCDELKDLCLKNGLNYDNAVRHLVQRKWLIRVFRGFWYVPTIEEKNKDIIKKPIYELIEAGLKHKKVVNWYFGLESALEFNDISRAKTRIIFVINDKIQRPNPLFVAGHMVRFIKIKPSLFGFGVVHEKPPYSDLEKTVLDLVYLKKYRGLPDAKIYIDIRPYLPRVDKQKIKKYVKSYPKTVQKLISEAII